ncbi:dihydrofolate reductase family protein [Leptospira meyeri]|uniref:dihydrofolate reductase family protein n=1 Tax=Leptospira meyeri TaxID=29508 RepID=UPI0010838179|nr:dihydrofolate reductase family protein [Leptospira meyeri]MCW7488283.1 dihydrofolate reductase family protein [Leptospira meyeri]TGL15258.1 dihydrofolate reductase [Leptospira meyeri]
MSKIIAAFNMTLNGNCDHNAGIPDEEIHIHYADLLDTADYILYGRITYQLMQFWQSFLETPSSQNSMNDFAASIDKIKKIVFSHSLKETGWDSAILSDKPIEEKIMELKKITNKDIFVGSRSLIIQLIKHNLIDELQLCIHPVIAENGIQLFENLNTKTNLKFIKTKIFSNGAIILYYKPTIDNIINE